LNFKDNRFVSAVYKSIDQPAARGAPPEMEADGREADSNQQAAIYLLAFTVYLVCSLQESSK
jgi:hypothetical protein